MSGGRGERRMKGDGRGRRSNSCFSSMHPPFSLFFPFSSPLLSSLQESSCEIREALHSLLSSCRITTRDGLNSTIHALLDNLKKYPNDSQSIWKYVVNIPPLPPLPPTHSHSLPFLPSLVHTHTGVCSSLAVTMATLFPLWFQSSSAPIPSSWGKSQTLMTLLVSLHTPSPLVGSYGGSP